MQLPRGKFRSIRKGVQLGEILSEMVKTRFTGICTFSSDTVNGTLVFRSGACVLAEVQNGHGDAAWMDTKKIEGEVIDAVLSDLDTAQLQLALEFNKRALVGTGSGRKAAAPARAAEARNVPDEKKPAAPVQRYKQKERDFIKTTPVPAAPPVAKTPPGREPAAAPAKTDETAAAEGKAGQEAEGGSGADRELDTFDSMDLDDMAQKIRKDAKIILKQLQLDHLSEK
jgi:hypothetical protein